MSLTAPAGWHATRIDRVAKVSARIGWKALTADEYVDDGYAFLATPNIKTREIDFAEVNRITRFRFDESPDLKLQIGDVLLAKDGNTLGITNVVAHLPEPATVNGSIAVVRPYAVEPRFLRYWLASAYSQAQISALKDGMGVPHLFQRDINRMPVVCPPMDEQRRIADFLDTETARLDALVAARREQVHLIEERARTVLDEAVDGLPQFRLARLLQVLQDGTHQPPVRVPSGVPLLTARNVSTGTLRLTGADTMVSEQDALILERALRPVPGDVLLSVKGTIGAVARMPRGFPRAVLDRNVALLRPVPAKLRAEWLELALRSRYVQEQFRVSINAAAQPGLPLGTIAATRLPAPPVGQQAEAALRIARQQQAMDAAAGAISKSIELIAERRQALITAAVTGHLDVTTARGVHA